MRMKVSVICKTLQRVNVTLQRCTSSVRLSSVVSRSRNPRNPTGFCLFVCFVSLFVVLGCCFLFLLFFGGGL